MWFHIGGLLTLPSKLVYGDIWLYLVEDLFYTQHVLCPTRGDAVLGLVLTSEPDMVSDVRVIDSPGSSDHNMVVFTTHLSCTPYISNKQVWDYKLGNYEEINDALAEVDWDDFMSGTVRFSA